MGCFQGVFRASIAADWIVAISEASRKHYLQIFPHFPEDRIQVIYPCSRFSDTHRMGTRPKALEHVPEGEFWLSVGTIEPRKNQRRLAEAYARYLALHGKPMPLIFAGGNGWLMEDFQNHLRRLGIEEQVILTGYITDDELIWLYRSCYANLYPSLFEGFGLPVLEGMQFGAATITANTTSLPEVAGSAAILLAPEDTEAWAQTMLHLAQNKDKRNQMKEASCHQALLYDWKQSARTLLQTYEHVMNLPKRFNAGETLAF